MRSSRIVVCGTVLVIVGFAIVYFAVGFDAADRPDESPSPTTEQVR